MIVVKNAGGDLPKLELVEDYYVHLRGNHFQQNKTFMSNNIGFNIYCIYKLDPISSSRDNTFTVQNALFGAMQITKNADTSKYKYEGYGICFDEGGMGDLFVQRINGTTLYAEKIYSQNFTQPSKKFVLSLHYNGNGNDSYLFVNGKQELKFKAKTGQLLMEK